MGEETRTTARPKRSRRDLLAGAAGAFSVLAAEGLAKVPAARAVQGQAVIAGEDNTETALTRITNTSTGADVLGGGFLGSGGPGGPSVPGGTGVKGIGGRLGGIGVFGQGGDDRSPNGGGGDGVLGQGGKNASAYGVRGTGGTPNGTGVFGIGQGTGVGVLGQGGYSDGPGVWGYGGSGGGDGVRGQGNVKGTGIVGTGGEHGGHGVRGFARSSKGVGVLAVGAATGLQVIGAAVFSRSGQATVEAGSRTKIVNNVGLAASSFILATVQDQTNVAVKAVVRDLASNSFKIVLTKAAKANTLVGWFIVN